jgi:hypothetical protein
LVAESPTVPSDDPLEDLLDDADKAERELRPDDPAEGLGPEIPEAPSTTTEGLTDLSNSDIDPELKRQFWSLVLLFNVALFATSLGVMLVGFEGRWTVGGAIFAVGAFAFLRGWRGYKNATSDAESADD